MMRINLVDAKIFSLSQRYLSVRSPYRYAIIVDIDLGQVYGPGILYDACRQKMTQMLHFLDQMDIMFNKREPMYTGILYILVPQLPFSTPVSLHSLNMGQPLRMPPLFRLHL